MDTNDAPWRFHAGAHKQFAVEYLKEISGLAKAAALPEFDRFVSQLSDYEAFLSSRVRLSQPLSPVIAASNGTRIVDLATNNTKIHEAMTFAHIAACCHLLHSSRLARSCLKRKTLLLMARQFLRSCENKPEDYRARMVHKFHTMDAMRTIQFLRALGLVTRPSSAMYQLGIGAAEGTRDVLSIHLVPRIDMSCETGGPFLTFRADQQTAAESIIIDAEPLYEEQYAALNQDDSMNVIAYNCDTLGVLKILPDEMPHKRNFVTALRIDHRGLPDVGEFFRYLGTCVDEDCDLVMTIGAGDTVQDFEGRIKKFGELFAALERVGLRPVLFKLHGPGSPAKQQKSLYYGNVRASSYQILYCKLSANALSRHL